MKKEDFVYSLDNERYYDLDDILEQVDEDTEFVYRGVKNPYAHSDFIDGKAIIESITNGAYDASDEYSENYISHLEEKGKDYHLVIERLISEYLNKTVPQPDFFRVEKVEEIAMSELR
ncbi:MAG: hypothetical protein KKA19_06260 [Candidatus Margulisbacteria bacterium]|nr:hypothetical protein [Candidatus Margulisiibacteriota bacterium]